MLIDAARIDIMAEELSDMILSGLVAVRGTGPCACGHDHDRGRKEKALPSRAAMFAALYASLIPWERRWSSALRSVWAEERRQILSNLKRAFKRLPGVPRAKSPADIISTILYPKTTAEKKLAKTLKPVISSMIAQYGERTISLLVEMGMPVNITFDIGNPAVVKWLNDYTVELSKNLEAVNTDDLKRELAAGLDAGETMPELARRVNDIFENYDRYRAEKIARTETIRASNQGALEAYKQSGVVEKKIWIASADACEACLELDGKVERLEDSFFNDDYSDGQTPPLHPNCRCAVAVAPEK